MFKSLHCAVNENVHFWIRKAAQYSGMAIIRGENSARSVIARQRGARDAQTGDGRAAGTA